MYVYIYISYIYICIYMYIYIPIELWWAGAVYADGACGDRVDARALRAVAEIHS
jgi:hypothetical protein